MRPLKTAGSVRSVHRTTASTAASACLYTTQTQMRPRPRVHTKKKPAEPQIPPSWKPFEMPNVVLDLDGWETSYTRPYAESEKRAQAKKWAYNPQRAAMLKRVTKFEFDLKRAKHHLAQVAEGNSRQPWQWQVTDVDIMTAALKGPKRPHGADGDEVLGTVTLRNGIPMTAYQDEKRLLEWLLHRMSSAARPQLVETWIPSLIAQQTTALDLRRLVSTLLNSDHHSGTVLQNTDKIAAVLSNMLDPRSKQARVGFLPFFNSVFFLCQQKGHTLGSPLCGIFMRISAEAFQLQSLTAYLRYGFRERYWHGESAALPDVLATLRLLITHMRKENNESQFSFGGGGGQTPTFPSARNLSPNHPAAKRLLRRLLTNEAGVQGGAWFKAIVEKNPANEELHHLHQQLLDAVNYQPPDPEGIVGESLPANP